MKKKTFVNLMLIGFVLSFFVTPMGFYAKLYLQRIFSSSVKVDIQGERVITYDWKLKDENDRFFSFERSKNHIVVVYFFASWSEKSLADLKGMYHLYNDFKNEVDFYFVSNERAFAVKEMMHKNDYNFPVSYIISDDTPSPFNVTEVPSGYIIDKKANIRAKGIGVSSWDSDRVRALLNKLIKS